MSKSNVDYWEAKVAANRRRDARMTTALRSRGWVVIRIWECLLVKEPGNCIARIKKGIKKGERLIADGRRRRDKGEEVCGEGFGDGVKVKRN